MLKIHWIKIIGIITHPQMVAFKSEGSEFSNYHFSKSDK